MKDAEMVAFKKALVGAMKKAGCGQWVDFLAWEHCSTDRTWGDRVGLVFWGAPDEVNERAAKFFQKWAAKNLNDGSYDAQRSIGYVGKFFYSRYANGAHGWYRIWDNTKLPKVGEGSKFEVCGEMFHNKCEEVRLGHATSYVYYPDAD